MADPLIDFVSMVLNDPSGPRPAIQCPLEKRTSSAACGVPGESTDMRAPSVAAGRRSRKAKRQGSRRGAAGCVLVGD